MVTTRRGAAALVTGSLLPERAKIRPSRKNIRIASRNPSPSDAILSKQTKSQLSLPLSNRPIQTPTHAINESISDPNENTIANIARRKTDDVVANVLFDLNDVTFDPNEKDVLVKAKLVSRPSKRNRSPYVADVLLLTEQREALAHVPNLDMGGKCAPGCIVLVKASIDKKTGKKVGRNAVSTKFGTPKCEFITQLVYVDDAARVINNTTPPKETDCESTLGVPYTPNILEIYRPVWVGAHPSLGERIAEIWLRNNMIPTTLLPQIESIQKQVVNPFGYQTNIRPDFCVTHTDGTKRIIEVKTVVDTDYSSHGPLPGAMISTTESSTKKKNKQQCIFTSDSIPYKRTALFPFGTSNQKGPDGEVVVSARAIHHVQELTKIQQTTSINVTILFVIVRNDIEQFSPNIAACPSFCKYLKIAEQEGVQIIPKCVSWNIPTDDRIHQNDVCNCCDDKIVPIVWP